MYPVIGAIYEVHREIIGKLFTKERSNRALYIPPYNRRNLKYGWICIDTFY